MFTNKNFFRAVKVKYFEKILIPTLYVEKYKF